MQHTTQPQTILFLAANPKETDRLQLGREASEIEISLRLAKQGNRFRFAHKHAVTDEELRRALLDYEPAIVHFAGHGSHDGLMLEQKNGAENLVSEEAVGELFALFAGCVQCVVLNACYTESLAELISQHVPYVIGMKRGIGDRAAIKFATGFYDALGAGRSVEEAFAFGRNAINLGKITGMDTPILKKSNPQPQKAEQVTERPAINETINVFVSYADKDAQYKDELITTLYPLIRQDKIRLWQQGDIVSGQRRDDEIRTYFEQAHLVMVLLSPDYIRSEVCYSVELANALEAEKRGEKTIIPVQIRPCGWQDLPIGAIQGIPQRPIANYSKRDSGWQAVYEAFKKALESLQSRQNQ